MCSLEHTRVLGVKTLSGYRCKYIHHSIITTIIFNHSEAYRCMRNHGTLISFQPPVHWFHFNHNDYIQAYNSVITHNTFNFIIILKHIETYVTMIPWFPFNPQYTGFISTMMITYNSITQSSHITHSISSY